MAFLDDFNRRLQTASTMAPPPIGPDIAPMASAAPPNLMNGAGAPGLMPMPQMGGGGGSPPGLSAGAMTSLGQLGGAIGNKLGQMGDAKASKGMYDSPMPPKKPPFQPAPPYENA